LQKLAIDDQPTFRAARYYRRSLRLSDTTTNQDLLGQKLRQFDTEAYVADRIYVVPAYNPPKRSLVLRLLAGQDDETISAQTGLSPTTIALYHDLFFAIRAATGAYAERSDSYYRRRYWSAAREP
jgi:hypothetical protein